jgi:hypothetical protein
MKKIIKYLVIPFSFTIFSAFAFPVQANTKQMTIAHNEHSHGERGWHEGHHHHRHGHGGDHWRWHGDHHGHHWKWHGHHGHHGGCYWKNGYKFCPSHVTHCYWKHGYKHCCVMKHGNKFCGPV